MFKAVIIGCGRIGCGFDDDPRRGYVSTHAGAYIKVGGVKLVALSDIMEESLYKYADKFNVPRRYTDYREMLAKEKPDIVSICTLANVHLPMVRDAVKAGVKAIFCEKPIADNLHAADEIIKICKDNNVILMIDHQRRFEQSHRKLAKFIHSGGLGQIQQATCYYVGGIANTGAHLFDFLCFLFGDADWVEGNLSINKSPNPSDPNIDTRIGFKSGTIVCVQACDHRAYAIFEIVLLGEKGRLRITSVGAHVEFKFEEVKESQWGIRELFPAKTPVSDRGPHEYMIEGVIHLIDCLKDNRRPYSTGEDGRVALEMICATLESAQNHGKRIYLPFRNSSIILSSK